MSDIFDQMFAETSQQISRPKKQPRDITVQPPTPISAPSREERRHREIQRSAIELRKRGWSYDDIGDELGVEPSEAYYATLAYLRRVAGEYEEIADLVRVLENERLDEMFGPVFEKAVQDADLEAVRTALKLMDRRAKLRGLDAPKRITADVRRADIRLQVTEIRHALEKMGDNDLEERYREALEVAGCGRQEP